MLYHTMQYRAMLYTMSYAMHAIVLHYAKTKLDHDMP